jgi:outer membrane immunogenic protein
MGGPLDATSDQEGLTIMKSRTIRNCIAIAAFLTAPIAAWSADMPRPQYKAPEFIAPASSWTGLYVGINGGYGWGNSNWTGASGNFQAAPAGWMGGGTIGYNYQWSAFVLGIEGDIDYMNLKGTADAAICSGCTFKDTWLGTLRGRAGFAFDRWLPYITGGLAYGNAYVSGPNGGSATGTKQGWTAGAGVEYAFANAWSAKLEYLYVDLNSVTCAQAACGFASDVQVHPTANLVRGGLNYRF